MSATQHDNTRGKTRKRGFFGRLICCGVPDIQDDSSTRNAIISREKQPAIPSERKIATTTIPAPVTNKIDEKVTTTSNIDIPQTQDPAIVNDIEPQIPGSPTIVQAEAVALATDQPLVPSSAAVISSEHFPGDTQNASEPHDLEATWLLPPISQNLKGKKCLVLDLDETLVHSSFKVIHQADFVVPVEIDGIFHNVYVIKRPGVDDFMKRVGEHFEIVVFTASLAKYADPVLDILDIHHVVHHRLFRESCFNHMGNYVKDLSQLGRDLRETIIIDNSPASYVFHPAHAVPISSWFNDVHDTELIDLIPFLIDLTTVNDVSQVLELSL